jgi:hypothetical protein
MSSTATETVMRTTRTALLTGAAAIVLAGYAGLAEAKSPETHLLTVRLPDGRLEQIRYTGDIPPTVILAPDTTPAAFDPGSPFAMLDRMTAAMDREAEAMFREIDAMTANPGGVGLLPAMSGPGVCMRSIQVTYAGNGQAPHVVSQTSGDCGGARVRTAPAALPNAPVPAQSPKIVEAKLDAPSPGLVQSDSQR